jgi:lysine 2,3-aminomutase
VLLRGINDSVATQTKLCQGLLKIKVRPYYLFQCDEVEGTEHLRTPLATGLEIIEGMRGHTSGLAVPTFVIDLPQGGGKVPVQPNYILSQNGDRIMVRNYRGHIYHCHNPRPKARAKPVPDLVRVAVPVKKRGAGDADRLGLRP